MQRIIGALALLFALSLMTGCGVVKVAYNNAPSLTYWWLDDYVDLSDDQTAPARSALQDLHAWHRKTELPVYVITLKKMQQLSPIDVTPAQVCELTGDVRAAVLRLGEQSERSFGALLPTLQAEQFIEMTRKFDKVNKKWREEWLEGSPKERFEKRLKKAVDRAEMLYGRLQEPQLQVLRQSISQSSFDARLSYRETQRRQQDVLQTFKEHSSSRADRAAHSRAQVLALVQRSVTSPDPEYRSYADKMILESCNTLANLHNSTSPAQRAKALKTLQDYEIDFKTLAAQPI